MFFDDLQLALNPNSKQNKKATFVPKELIQPQYELKPYTEYTDEELQAACGCVLVYDIECYSNYFLIAFKCVATKRVVTFEMSPDCPHINVNKLNWIVHNFTLVSFNGIKFDRALLFMAIYGCVLEQFKYVSDRLIDKEDKYNVKACEKEFGFTIPAFNHIDLIEVAPSQVSLKVYAGRTHAPRMQDLPYEPNKVLTRDEAEVVKYYCVNDLDNTIILLDNLEGDIELRYLLSEEYQQDLRSLSDAQIAEHVLSAECAKVRGFRARRPIIATGTVYNYEPPAFIQFQTQPMQELLESIKTTEFVINDKGQPKCEFLKGLKIPLGESVYTMGIGGLHSTEKSVAHYARNGKELIDVDVESYYPRILINNGYFPKHMGDIFIEVYERIVNRRLEAKRMSKSDDEVVAKENKKVADSLKITINGSFGKLGSKWSELYSPDLLIQITITGQLSLLMLIETLELVGIHVVSANTDGIVTNPSHDQVHLLRRIISEWEAASGFKMEETHYKALFSRDVNNYIAIKKNFDKNTGEWLDEFPDGTKIGKMYKGKGVFGETTLRKQPFNEICAKAVSEFLINGTPIAETLRNCKDLGEFVTCKVVKGGAEKDALFLGKAIRWYYATGVSGTINYITNGNTVPNSQGAKPIMDFPETFPDDIDYDQYENMCESMLADLGFYENRKGTKSTLFNWD